MKRQIKKILDFFIGLFNIFKLYLLDYKKMKNSELVFFFPFYHTGGAERVHLNIVQAVSNKKCCIIFTQNSATQNFLKGFKQIGSVVELNSILNKRSKTINKILENTLLKAMNNSIHIKTVFGANSNYFYEILPKISYSKLRVDLIHALAENDDREILLTKSARFLDNRIVINKKGKKDFEALYKSYNIPSGLLNKINTIQNGISIPEEFDFNINDKDFSKIKIGFIGRWSEEKRPNVFLKTAKIINNLYDNVSFVMAGTGMKSNIDAIENSGVLFLGEITDNSELKELYNALNICVISSVYEGFPMVFMESMLYGVIPISTNVGGVSEHITNSENGFLIDDNSSEDVLVKDFVKCIQHLINDTSEFKLITERSHNYAIENFNIKKFNKSYQKLLINN
ncbi:hypothetical protein DIS18_11275 [Algibacter marinivivus]|uniref:Glycosyl transferase family 1 domain-containing protein n=1 Tax=Algibacter marinivivus TaxID=2100723 RepID=A0A2U2X4T9_9FLAO|nr:glycosyltransferase family 4 protein [Algibacter marinivivus]PWH82803.1 hypothetical protein DIS18_11275 [Algibacter marinivivus]